MLTLISWVLPAILERFQDGSHEKRSKYLYGVISAYQQNIYIQDSQLHFYNESLTNDLNKAYSR